MLKQLNEDTRAWIEKMYGRVSVFHITVYVAHVPVMNGIASGKGMSEQEAIESLYKDLTLVEGPVDAEPPRALAAQREADAAKCEGLVTFTKNHGCSCEPCAWCLALETAAEAIREGHGKAETRTCTR